jgi:hypothetical protein
MVWLLVELASPMPTKPPVPFCAPAVACVVETPVIETSPPAVASPEET